MGDAQPIIYTLRDEIATITLNRPAAMNAMTDELMRGISESVAQVENDNSIRAVIVTGAGRGFCAGADLASVARGSSSSRAKAIGVDPNGEFVRAMRAIAECPVPTIARINGPAAGAGFGLALACDISVAAESAFFVATFGPKLGIVPDMGATWNIPLRVGRARALGITLLGERISAAKAERWGLIWSAVADRELDNEVARIASILAQSQPEAVTRTRQTIGAATGNTFSEQLDLEMEHQNVLIPRNMHEGAKAFLEGRQPKFSNKRG